MADLCRFLSGRMNQKVVDRTGIDGVFDIDLKLDSVPLAIVLDAIANGGEAVLPDPGNEIRQALASLGLRLVPAKADAETIVVDRIERPSEN